MARTCSRQKKVFVVDDHPIMRQGLLQLVIQETDMAICGEAENVADALKGITQSSPDIIIADLSLGTEDGFELIKDIRTRWPYLPVLVLSMHSHSLYAERAFRAGARGYVLKNEASSVVIDAIRQVLNGRPYVSKAIASDMINRLVSARSGPASSPLDALSDREFQIFEMIGQGVRTSEIAQKLHVSIKTVDSHREHIKKKLNLHNATALLQYAIQWVQLERKE